MRRSWCWWLVTVLSTLTLVAACGGGPGGGGTPGTETPSALALPFSVPAGTPGTQVRADALTRSGGVWAHLVSVAASASSMTLPAQLPGTVGLVMPDVGAELCPGALSAPTPSVTPGRWLELRELWVADGAMLTALRRSTRPGLSLDDPSGYQAGDVIVHWVYSDRSLTLSGACSYPFGITRTLALALDAGWTAIATQVDAIDAGSGFPSAMTTRNATASDDAAWHAAEAVLESADVIWAPASAHHGDRASWWGSNHSKLVRSGDELWLSVVDNGGPEPLARVVRRDGDGWEALGAWPSLSPAQLVLVAGEPYALVHRVDPDATGDTLGQIDVYDRSGAAIATQHAPGLVNIRFGTTVGPDGTLRTAWGVGSDQLAYAELDVAPGAAWSESIRTGIPGSFRYPYLALDAQRLVTVVAENAFIGPGEENRYHSLLLIQQSLDGSFGDDLLVFDAAAELPDLAATRRRLVEVSDVRIDAAGNAHVLVKVFDDASDAAKASLWHRVAPSPATSVSSSADGAVRPHDDRPPPPPAPAWSDWSRLDGLTCSWARFVNVPDVAGPTVACAEHGQLRFATLDGASSVALRVPPGVLGPYLYVAEGRSGSASDEPWIDLFVVAGSASAYPSGPALVVSVPRLAVAVALAAP